MQKKKKKNEPEPAESTSLEILLRDWLSSDFIINYGKKAGIALIIIALGISVFLYQLKNASHKVRSNNKLLGKAYVYYSQNKMDSAELFLKNFLSWTIGFFTFFKISSSING